MMAERLAVMQSGEKQLSVSVSFHYVFFPPSRKSLFAKHKPCNLVVMDNALIIQFYN